LAFPAFDRTASLANGHLNYNWDLLTLMVSLPRIFLVKWALIGRLLVDLSSEKAGTFDSFTLVAVRVNTGL
jgi:hypothetical protein